MWRRLVVFLRAFGRQSRLNEQVPAPPQRDDDTDRQRVVEHQELIAERINALTAVNYARSHKRLGEQ